MFIANLSDLYSRLHKTLVLFIAFILATAVTLCGWDEAIAVSELSD